VVVRSPNRSAESYDPDGRRLYPRPNPPFLPDTMDIDAETCLKDWNDLAQDFKELEVRIPVTERGPMRLGAVSLHHVRMIAS